jgi:hypothetical protein
MGAGGSIAPRAVGSAGDLGAGSTSPARDPGAAPATRMTHAAHIAILLRFDRFMMSDSM